MQYKCAIYVYCLYVPEYPAWTFSRAISKTFAKRLPIVVVSGGRVVARTRSHRLRSVNLGDTADRARRLCPEAVIRVRDVQLERTCWEAVLREINIVTPFIEASEPPFVNFSECSFPDARSLAIRLSAQVGAGKHRSVARFAALRSARGHVLRVRAQRWVPFLRRFEVGRLEELSFSEDMLEQLRLFGYGTLDGARRLNARQMEAQFGEEGQRLYEMLHPGKEDRIPLYVPPPAIERWYAYDDPVAAQPVMLEPVLKKLIDQAAEGLGVYRSQRIRLGVHAEGAREPRWAERILSSPQRAPGTLFRLTDPMMGGLLESSMEVERVGIRLESLRPPSVRQSALFDERPAVLGAVRTVHRRYPGFIRRAVVHEHTLFEEDEMALEVRAEDHS